MAHIEVYLSSTGTGTGDGTSGDPYLTWAELQSNIVSDTALTSLDLVTQGHAVTVHVSGTITDTSRHDITGWTLSDPRTAEPGDTGILAIVGDADGIGGGAQFTVSVTTAETILCREDVLFEKLNFEGANTVSKDMVRQFNNVNNKFRYCYFGLNGSTRRFLDIDATGETILQDCVISSTCAQNITSGTTGDLTTIHCVFGSRLLMDTGGTWTSESDIHLHTSTPSLTGSTSAVNNSSFYGASFTPDSGSGNTFVDRHVSDGVFNDAANEDYNLTSTGNTNIGALGAGTGTSGVLSTDINGTARGVSTAAQGAFEYDAGGGGGFQTSWAINSNKVI